MNPFDPGVEIDNPIIAIPAVCIVAGVVYLVAFAAMFAYFRRLD